MKTIKRFFDAQRPRFSPGGRLEKWFPFFEAMETVFFASDTVTAGQGPHIRDSLDLKRYLATVLLVLMPLFFFGVYNAGFQSRRAAGIAIGFWPVIWTGAGIVLPIVIVSYGVGFAWEILFAAVRRHPISEGLFLTAMLFPLTLPPTTPLWQVALGISFGIVIGKEIFGGTGRNFLNPALTGRAFLYFAYPAQMTGDTVWVALTGIRETAVDAITAATPLVVAAATHTAGAVEKALSDTGYSAATLFFGWYPDSIGASSALLCLIGAIVLVLMGIASYRIILGDILGLLATGFLLNLLATPGSSPYMTLNPFYHLIMGGTAFGFAFMTTDPVSAPDLHAARWIYGAAIGALTVLIRVFNPAFPAGIMLAILFMNVLAPLLDHLALRVKLNRRVPNV